MKTEIGRFESEVGDAIRTTPQPTWRSLCGREALEATAPRWIASNGFVIFGPHAGFYKVVSLTADTWPA